MFEVFFHWRCKQQVRRNIASSQRSQALELMGRGSGRLCYRHPTDKALCIKIPGNSRGRTECIVENRYMKLIRFFHKEDTTDRITAFYGPTCTSIGIGWVAEIAVIDSGGELAPQLHECLTPEAFADETELWRQAFDDFMAWCFSTSVVVRDASINNICVKRLDSGELRFLLIDGIGPRGSLPRWLPLKSYAHKRNRAYAAKSHFTSIENLVAFCDKYRQDHDFHRDKLVDVPKEPVYCFISDS